MGELPQERLLIADIAVASAEFVFEKTREFCKDRQAFGRSIDKFQVRALPTLAILCVACTPGAVADPDPRRSTPTNLPRLRRNALWDAPSSTTACEIPRVGEGRIDCAALARARLSHLPAPHLPSRARRRRVAQGTPCADGSCDRFQ